MRTGAAGRARWTHGRALLDWPPKLHMDEGGRHSTGSGVGKLSDWIVDAQARRRQRAEAARRQRPPPVRRSARRARKQRLRVAAIYCVGLIVMVMALLVALSRR